MVLVLQTREILMARARLDAAAVESMAATGVDCWRREVASSGRSGTAQSLSVHEGAVVVLTIGSTTVHAKITKMVQGSSVGSSKQRRSAARNTREAFEARQRRRASAARVMTGTVPPGLGLEQHGATTWCNMDMEEMQQGEEMAEMAAPAAKVVATKRVAAVDTEDLAPAPCRSRVQGPWCSKEVEPAVVSVVVGRARAARTGATPAAKVARRGRWDDAASASVAARERRRQSERDAALGWSGVDESARYVFM
jgi:hypothetical protein